MVKATGRDVASDIEFVFENPGKDNWASYNPSTPKGSDIVQWTDYFKNGKIVVKVDRGVMWNPQKAMRAIVHETYELERLRAAFAASGGKMSRKAVGDLITRLHKEALEVEKQAWKDWVALPKNE
jgi:hypothetical protein